LRKNHESTTTTAAAPILTLLLGVALAQGADPPAPPEARALVGRLGQRLRTLAGQDRFSGEMLVSVDGKVVASERFGRIAARSEAEGPNIYPIASVTKTITAIGVLLLASDVSSP
jgi:CubicO group peptidase (beta-lactamase class C family)